MIISGMFRIIGFIICVCNRYNHAQMTDLPYMHIIYYLIWDMCPLKYLRQFSFASICLSKSGGLDKPWRQGCIQYISLNAAPGSRKRRQNASLSADPLPLIVGIQ